MLGVVANTEGRAEIMSAAMEIFLAAGVELVVHCGDVGGRHVLDSMAQLNGIFVWGERDPDRMGLLRYGQSLGIGCFGLMGEFEYGGKKFIVLHGNDKKVLKKLIDEQQYDYVLVGHELATEDRTVGRTRVINPGPLHGGQARSAILLDPETGKLKLLALS
ncbi:MAG TPA: metallophosphoesterase family protein [Tepidisphaeraceae bacterium]|jgi:putative phosphoesterase|nr:metallophosphoesterase family protein [Tepidisphaeraceae bacterium]